MNALPLIVFDVNETLLDLTTLEPTFERIFRDKGAMRFWFANLIMYSSALTVAGCYVPFTDIGSDFPDIDMVWHMRCSKYAMNHSDGAAIASPRSAVKG